MADITALEKHRCPACGAQAEWNPAKQKLVCPFCGTESPYADRSRRRARSIENDLVRRRCASCRTTSAAGRPNSAQRPVPELQGGDGLRRRSASARTASSAARRRSSPTTRSRRRSARRACCRSRSTADRSPRRHAPAGGRASGSRPTALSRAALVDTVHSLYIPYWTFDASVVLPVGRRGRPLLLRQRPRTGRKGKTQSRGRSGASRWEPASGEIDHFFDDEPVPGTQASTLDLLRQVEPFPTAGARALRHRLPVRARRRALPGRALDAAGASQSADARDARAALRARRCPATRTATCRSTRSTRTRRSSTSSCPSGCSPTLRPRKFPGRRQRLHRPSRVGIRSVVEDLLPRRVRDRRDRGDRRCSAKKARSTAHSRPLNEPVSST